MLTIHIIHLSNLLVYFTYCVKQHKSKFAKHLDLNFVYICNTSERTRVMLLVPKGPKLEISRDDKIQELTGNENSNKKIHFSQMGNKPLDLQFGTDMSNF